MLGWRIDTRARRGYVVGAGSIRRDGRYCITRRREIAALPTWLTDALTPAPPHLEATERMLRPLRRRGRYLQAILDSESDAVGAAQPGTRHTTLLAAACTLGRLVAGGELDHHQARDALLRAAARHVGIDDMTEREITDTITDGIRYGPNVHAVSRSEVLD